MACEADGIIEPGGLGGCIKGDFELWPFVLFDVDRGLTARVAGTEHQAAGEAIGRGGEAAAERAVVIGSVLLLGNFFAVDVAKLDSDGLVTEGAVGIAFLIEVDAKALVANFLPGAGRASGR